MQHRQIIDGEKLLTPSYWRLGHALVLAKKTLNHGQWARYLKKLGIDKTRASKARAIYRTFESEVDVAGLTVEEAYAKRQRNHSAELDEGADEAAEPKADVQRLRKSVHKIAEQTVAAIQDAAFAEREEANILIPAIRKTISQL